MLAIGLAVPTVSEQLVDRRCETGIARRRRRELRSTVARKRPGVRIHGHRRGQAVSCILHGVFAHAIIIRHRGIPGAARQVELGGLCVVSCLVLAPCLDLVAVRRALCGRELLAVWRMRWRHGQVQPKRGPLRATADKHDLGWFRLFRSTATAECQERESEREPHRPSIRSLDQRALTTHRSTRSRGSLDRGDRQDRGRHTHVANNRPSSSSDSGLGPSPWIFEAGTRRVSAAAARSRAS